MRKDWAVAFVRGTEAREAALAAEREVLEPRASALDEFQATQLARRRYKDFSY